MMGFIRLVLALFLTLGIATAFAEIVFALGWLVASAGPANQETIELLQSMNGFLESVTLLTQTAPWLVLTALACSYLVPALTAMVRGRQNAGGIFVLNLFLGWTVIGWVLALVWAVTGESGLNRHGGVHSPAASDPIAALNASDPTQAERPGIRPRNAIVVLLVLFTLMVMAASMVPHHDTSSAPSEPSCKSDCDKAFAGISTPVSAFDAKKLNQFGSLLLEDLMPLIEKIPKLKGEIIEAVSKIGKKPEDIACFGQRFSGEWQHLGGVRVAPYDCQIGHQVLEIESKVRLTGKNGKAFEEITTEAMRNAQNVSETELTWKWTTGEAYSQKSGTANQTETSAPNAIFVKISVAATPTNPPVIVGTTNLPDGTVLTADLHGVVGLPRPPCSPQCYWPIGEMIVNGGRFTGTLGEGKLIQDTYILDIIALNNLAQPPEVRAVIGTLGENLRGPYVVDAADFRRTKVAKVIGGQMIHFTQKVFVANDPATDAAARSAAIKRYLDWSKETCNDSIILMARGLLGANRQAAIDACIAEDKASANLR